jgi:arylsulfatase
VLGALPLLACRNAETPADGVADTAQDELAYTGVVVLHLDTFRADHLPAYGYERDTTPKLSERDWMVVHGLRSTASWTLPASASFLTSLEPQNHRMMFSTGPSNMPTLEVTSWAERLDDLGWSTGLFSGNVWVSEEDGMDRGFDFSEVLEKADSNRTNFADLSADALEWVDRRDPSVPFMMHLQPMDTHSPYNPTDEDLAEFRTDPMPFDEIAEGRGWDSMSFTTAWEEATTDEEKAAIGQGAIDVYDGCVLGLDREIDGFLDALDERGLLEKTVVVLTADHGESLDDNDGGLFAHDHGWREELVQLPWMMLHSELVPGDVACLSSNVDVWPTLATLVSVEGAEGLDGMDVAQGCRDLTRGSLWGNNGTLETLGVATEQAALKRDCESQETAGTLVGDGADRTETTPPEELPGGDELNQAIDDLSLEISEKVAGRGCKGA